MTDSLIKAFDYSRRLGRYVYAYEAYGSNWNIIASNKPGYRYALTISPLTGESIHIQLYPLKLAKYSPLIIKTSSTNTSKL